METSLARNSHGGEWDNNEVVNRIAKLRAERAALLGYESHAAYQLEDQTAKDVGTVNKLLSNLAPPAVANAKREGADIQGIIDQEKGGFALALGTGIIMPKRCARLVMLLMSRSSNRI